MVKLVGDYGFDQGAFTLRHLQLRGRSFMP